MANNEDSETKEIDKLIVEAYEEEKELKNKLVKVRNLIKSLVDIRARLTGQSIKDSSQKSIPDLLEEILRENGKPMHVDELLLRLKSTYKMPTVGKQTISGALIRYANQGRRFKRAEGKNTFTLLDKNTEEKL